jgi:hypothetical protein
MVIRLAWLFLVAKVYFTDLEIVSTFERIFASIAD